MGQGQNTAEPGPADVDDIFHGMFQEALLGGETGIVEGTVIGGGGKSGLHHGDLIDAGGQPLGDKGAVILHGFGEHLLFQPEAGENMAGADDQQGMQPRRFQTGGIEEGQVQAGTQLLIQHFIAQPHPLSRGLVAGGGLHVCNALFLDGGEDSRRLAHRPVGILGLVAVQGGIPGPLAQEMGGPGQDAGNRRVVGGDEGGQQFRVQAETMPLVKGQDLRLGVGIAQLGGLVRHLHGNNARDLLRQGSQVLGVHGHLGPGDLHRLMGRDAVDVPGEGDHKFRAGADLDVQILQRGIGIIGDGHGLDGRRTAPLEAEIDGGQHRHRHPDLPLLRLVICQKFNMRCHAGPSQRI